MRTLIPALPAIAANFAFAGEICFRGEEVVEDFVGDEDGLSSVGIEPSLNLVVTGPLVVAPFELGDLLGDLLIVPITRQKVMHQD